MIKISDYENACLKRDCVKIAMDNGAKQSIEKDACLEIAKKIYCFVIGKGDKAPEEQGATG